MTEQPTSASPKCPKCFSPEGAPHGDHYSTCPDYRSAGAGIAGTLAEFYTSPEYRAAVLTGEPMAGGPDTGCSCWNYRHLGHCLHTA